MSLHSLSKFHLSLQSQCPNFSPLYQNPNYYWHSKFLYPQLFDSHGGAAVFLWIFFLKLFSNRLCNMPAMCSLFPWNDFFIHLWTHGCIFHLTDVSLMASLMERNYFPAPNFGRKSNSPLESELKLASILVGNRDILLRTLFPTRLWVLVFTFYTQCYGLQQF